MLAATVLSSVETTSGLERTLDLIGVFAFALSGGLLAVRKNDELVGVVALATVTALGGGVTRDLILGDTPPAAFENLGYLVVPLLAAVLIGVISAVGGGIARDVLADEQPSIFRPESTLYAIPAAIGATAVVITWNNGWYSGTIAIVTAIGVFAFRVAAMQLDWRAPRPVSRRH